MLESNQSLITKFDALLQNIPKNIIYTIEILTPEPFLRNLRINADADT